MRAMCGENVEMFKNLFPRCHDLSRLVTTKLWSSHKWHWVSRIPWTVRKLFVTDGTTLYDMAQTTRHIAMWTDFAPLKWHDLARHIATHCENKIYASVTLAWYSNSTRESTSQPWRDDPFFVKPGTHWRQSWIQQSTRSTSLKVDKVDRVALARTHSQQIWP